MVIMILEIDHRFTSTRMGSLVLLVSTNRCFPFSAAVRIIVLLALFLLIIAGQGRKGKGVPAVLLTKPRLAGGETIEKDTC